jgi:tetratricopeptide (TPR) repeat protein
MERSAAAGQCRLGRRDARALSCYDRDGLIGRDAMRFSTLGYIALSALAALAMSPAPAVADDAQTCERESGDVAIAACSREIASGRHQGHALAVAYDNRAVEYAKKNDYGRAFADYDEAIRLDPAFSHAYSNRGDAWRARGDLDRALADLNRAIELDASSSTAYYNRGLTWEAKHELQRALADFKKFNALDPSDPDGPQAVARVTRALSGK